DSATTGCQAVWLLKSRRISHTRWMGASMMADLVTRCIGYELKRRNPSTAEVRKGIPQTVGKWGVSSAMLCVLCGRCGWSPPSEPLLQRIEANLEHALADVLRELALARGIALELGTPLGKDAVAIGDRRELQRCDVVAERHRRLQ